MKKSSEILIAENDPEVATLYVDFFLQTGLEVLICNTAESAWKIFQKHEKQLQLVITDGDLGEHSGLWLANQIRSFSAVPILLASANVEKYYLADKDKIISYYLAKPFSPKEIYWLLSKYNLFPKK